MELLVSPEINAAESFGFELLNASLLQKPDALELKLLLLLNVRQDGGIRSRIRGAIVGAAACSIPRMQPFLLAAAPGWAHNALENGVELVARRGAIEGTAACSIPRTQPFSLAAAPG